MPQRRHPPVMTPAGNRRVRRVDRNNTHSSLIVVVRRFRKSRPYIAHPGQREGEAPTEPRISNELPLGKASPASPSRLVTRRAVAKSIEFAIVFVTRLLHVRRYIVRFPNDDENI